MDNSILANSDLHSVESLLPNEVETSSGRNIKIFRNRSEPPFLIRYKTSNIQGNILKGGSSEITLDYYEQLTDIGLAEDENGNEISSIVIPFDKVDIANGDSYLIIDVDLRMYVSGFHCLISFDVENKFSTTIENINKIIVDFIRIINALGNHGYMLKTWDGHEFFYNIEYGMLYFIVDGSNLIKQEIWQEEISAQEFTEKMTAAVILHMLIGSWSDFSSDDLRNTLLVDADDWICIENLEMESNGDVQTKKAWNTLSKEIREAFIRINSGDRVQLSEWSSVFQDIETKLDICPYCGKHSFSTSTNCFYCGASMKKDTVSAKWLIEDDSLNHRFKIIISRGVIIYGSMISPKFEKKPFAKLKYSPKNNSLGIQNISEHFWKVTINGRTFQISSGEVIKLESDLTIEMSRLPSIRMIFQGYECENNSK